jgi:phosphate transport system substrate-binding protein
MSKRLLLATVTCLVVMFAFPAKSDVILHGAGATFPQPLYKKWIEVYRKKTGVRISYQGIGSGGGIRRLLEKSTDFSGTDAFLSDDELSPGGNDILHVPTCLGAVTVTYNLPGNPSLKFTPELIADIFLGKITRWSDKRISKVNPSIKLPDVEISVVHRSDGSGTSFVFTSYLSRVSDQWKKRVGRGKTVRWPTGLGVEGNPNVAEFVGRISGSIGYVELTYAKSHLLPVAFVKNKHGRFVEPTLESVSSAAEVVLPEDTRILIVDTDATNGYPISAFTWLIFYKEQSYNNRSKDKAESLARFLWWAVHSGQRYNKKLFYAPLPEAAVKKAEAIISSMTFNGEQVWQR